MERSMLVFEHVFRVRAPLARVAAFHRDTRALRRLTPPPIFVQLHRADPLAEGAVADFTLWFGLLPVRWQAVHSAVDAQRGFTDTQALGPLRHWRHRHTFRPIDSATTLVADRVEYQHYPGPRGLLSRLLFARPALRLLFAFRAWATRRALERR
jgi:ligand-binding SRPBCC domain-containing protein